MSSSGFNADIYCTFCFLRPYKPGGHCNLLTFDGIRPQQHFSHRAPVAAPGSDLSPDVTFLTEALPAVLTDMRLFPRVQLHVVPQRAGVSQQLGAECALHLTDKTRIKGSGVPFIIFKYFRFREKQQDVHENIKRYQETY